MMTLKDLYDEFRDAANYFGVGFRGFDEIKVWLEDGELVLEYDGRTIRLDEMVLPPHR